MTVRTFLILAALVVPLLAGCGLHVGQAGSADLRPAHVSADIADDALRFDIEEGLLLNSFLRQDRTAAHLLLRSSDRPRLIVAFPAGNSGVGLWFESTPEPVRWRIDGSMQALQDQDSTGRSLHGITANLEVDTRRLVVRDAVLSSIRVLRDYELSGNQPDEVQALPALSSHSVVWARDRLDGAPGYALSIEAIDDSRATTEDGSVVLVAAPGKPLRLRVRALTGETPLTPLTSAELLRPMPDDDVRSRQVLEFLSYREKFLAGSWRFDTYFGRDTLMSLRLLMPALQPEAVESGLRSVLVRLSPAGEVAHEEDIGEFAILRRLRQGAAPDDAPIYDYAMVDDDMMLAPVAAAWILDDARGRARAAAFLAATAAGGERNGHALARNLAFVADRTRAFAADPTAANLVGLKPGRKAGQWRDSDDGLGRGHYPYDVNAVFVPAALRAADSLVQSGLLDPYLSDSQRKRLAGSAQRASVWEESGASLFLVEIPAPVAAEQIRQYAAQLGVPTGPVPDEDRPVIFHAVSLDASGQPVPVMHSDEGFGWLFARPPARELSRTVANLMRPFPSGLMTDAGLLVANPVFSGPLLWKQLDASAYHGTGVWSWQQAMWAAGLQRQLARDDLPRDVRAVLVDAQTRLWQVIQDNHSLRTSELWAWSFEDGRYRAEPFGARGGDADESNAAQLWSTVFLALPPPQKRDQTPGTPEPPR